MPMSPGRLCRYRNCSEIVHPPEYLCATHKKVRGQQDRKRRGSSSQRGYDARHRRWRKMVLARHPVCNDCHMAISTHADHIIPLSKGGTWHLSNGQGLCASCHNKKTALQVIANKRDMGVNSFSSDMPATAVPIARTIKGLFIGRKT